MKRKTLTKGIAAQVANSVHGDAVNPTRRLLSSGVAVLDLALGGGYCWGSVINLVGDKSTAKTLLAAEVIAKARSKLKDNLVWYYDDAEGGFTFDTQAMYGINILHEDSVPSDTIEELRRNVEKQIDKCKRSGKKLIYVLDSLDSLTSEAERKRAVTEDGEVSGTYGLEKQKKFGEFFRLLRLKIRDMDCLFIVISQVRYNIGVMFGEKYIRTGGKALDFYASQILWLSEVDREIRNKITTGITIKAKITKNKIGKPYRFAFVDVLFDYGTDNVSSNICSLFDLRNAQGKIKEKGAKLEWKNKNYTIRGLIQHIEENNEEYQLEERVKEKWEDAEAKVSMHRKRKY